MFFFEVSCSATKISWYMNKVIIPKIIGIPIQYHLCAMVPPLFYLNVGKQGFYEHVLRILGGIPYK